MNHRFTITCRSQRACTKKSWEKALDRGLNSCGWPENNLYGKENPLHDYRVCQQGNHHTVQIPWENRRLKFAKTLWKCARTFYGLVQQKLKKSAWSKTDGKTRNSSWPKVTTHLSNMAVLLLWVSEWVIWLSCILPDEDQTIGRDSKKKKKRKQEAREMLKAI